MSGSSLDALRSKVEAMAVDPQSGYGVIKKLILEHQLDEPTSSAEVVRRIAEKVGERWKTSRVQTYMTKFMQVGVVHAVKPPGTAVNYWVLTHVQREDALRDLNKRGKIKEIEQELFSQKMMAKLSKDFSDELDELRDNFGKNGLSTAFLLRKILEKLIIIVLGKNGKQHLLKSKHNVDRWLGLSEMIDVAVQEKINGVSFLLPKTGQEIKGIKFLGDTAAHNPVATVDIKTIVPQMPYIITAYEELAKRI
jgi:hypothetical protein